MEEDEIIYANVEDDPKNQNLTYRSKKVAKAVCRNMIYKTLKSIPTMYILCSVFLFSYDKPNQI